MITPDSLELESLGGAQKVVLFALAKIDPASDAEDYCLDGVPGRNYKFAGWLILARNRDNHRHTTNNIWWDKRR